MLRTLTRVGMRRGLLGGSRPWTMVLFAAGGLRLIQRLAEGKEIVFRENLEPGTTLLITNDHEGAPLAAGALLAEAAAPAKLEE